MTESKQPTPAAIRAAIINRATGLQTDFHDEEEARSLGFFDLDNYLFDEQEEILHDATIIDREMKPALGSDRGIEELLKALKCFVDNFSGVGVTDAQTIEADSERISGLLHAFGLAKAALANYEGGTK